MTFEFAKMEDLEAIIQVKGVDDDVKREVYEYILSLIHEGYFVFRDKVEGKWFVVAPGQPIPLQFNHLLV